MFHVIKQVSYEDVRTEYEKKQVLMTTNFTYCPECGSTLFTLQQSNMPDKDEYKCSKCNSTILYTGRNGFYINKAKVDMDDLEDFLEKYYSISEHLSYQEYLSYRNSLKTPEYVYKTYHIDPRYCHRDKTNRVAESITYDTDNGKLSLFASFLHYVPTDTHVFKEAFYCKLIFNTKTKRCYFIGPKTEKKRKAFGSDVPLIMDISKGIGIFISSVFSHEMLEFFFNEANKLMNQKSPLNYLSEDKESRNDESIEIRIRALCYPNLVFNRDEYNDIVSLFKEGCRTYGHLGDFGADMILCPETWKAFSIDLTDTQTLIHNFVNKYKLPKTKRFMQLYFKNRISMDTVLFFKKCGFKNVDVLYRLATDYDIVRKITNCYTSDYRFGQSRTEMYRRVRVIFRQMLKAANSETVTYARIKNSTRPSMSLKDTVSMYTKIRKQNPMLIPGDLFAGKDLRQVHDKLSDIVNILKEESQEIPYTERERNYEASYGEYQISLAESTSELQVIGNEMHICVGGYGIVAMNKSSTILTFKDKNGSYVACIELNRKGRLVQAKGHGNRLLHDEVAKILKQWVEEKNIKCQTCYDYIYAMRSLNKQVA